MTGNTFHRARLALILIAALAPAACNGVPPPPDTAAVPTNAFGQNLDPDTAALNLAAYDFGDATRTYGNPAEAAKALAALDYIAGQLATNPRFGGFSALAQLRMLQARVAMRNAMGIALTATSQEVMTRLLAASAALAAGNKAQAAADLPPPAFPPDILQRLADMPYVASVNAATTQAADALSVGFPGGNLAP